MDLRKKNFREILCGSFLFQIVAALLDELFGHIARTDAVKGDVGLRAFNPAHGQPSVVEPCTDEAEEHVVRVPSLRPIELGELVQLEGSSGAFRLKERNQMPGGFFNFALSEGAFYNSDGIQVNVIRRR
ncbi:MAG: hypothetical protein NUV90_02850 [Candidatus Parcubacteria bacterium]|nr:hypothetical protein [Candidatus Parcubacteria bacterium]